MNTTDKILAKSDGTGLADHLVSVGGLAAELSSGMLADGVAGAAIGKLCRLAGLLHDIGKAVPSQQAFLRGGDFNGRYHNEYSALFVEMYGDVLVKGLAMELCMPVPHVRRILATAVYWHHAAAPDADGSYDQLCADVADIDAMKGVWLEVTGEELPDREIPDRLRTPGYVIDDEKICNSLNPVLAIVSAVLVAADRSVSSGKPIENKFYPAIGEVVLPKQYKVNKVRRQEQDEAVERAVTSPAVTTVVNAPAGWGKTLMGLLCVLRCGGRVLWVLPRNAPLDSTYDGIVRELTACGIGGVSVEKFYAHRRQASFVLGGELADGEDARITVTNIDAFVEPFGNDNAIRGLQYGMLRDTVVFDEYHEFVSDEPMYYAWRTVLDARTRYGKGRTLLVSATPIPLDLPDERVNYLPGKWQSYHAQHSDRYENLGGSPDLGADMAVMNLSVAEVQAVTSDCGEVLYVHSKYTDEDRREKFGRLYASYGKDATGEKVPVSAGPVIQASLDVSFGVLGMAQCSAQMSLQCLGRCNRFGDGMDHRVYWDTALSQGAQQYVCARYDRGLRDKWARFVHERIVGKTLTLDEIYGLYNEFMGDPDTTRAIIKWQRDMLVTATMRLAQVLYPERADLDGNGDGGRGAKYGNVTMRCSSPGIFYVVKRDDGEGYAGPFSENVESLRRPGNSLHDLELDVKFIKNLRTHVGDAFPVLCEKLCDGPRKKRDNYATFYVQSARCQYGRDGKAFRFEDTPLIVPDNILRYNSEKGIHR